MQTRTGRLSGEGAGLGLIAGVILAVAEMIVSAIMGSSAVLPLRLFGSVLLGRSALTDISAGTAILVGVVVHLALSAAFGALYGLLSTRVSDRTRTSSGREAGLGMLYGAALWLINFQIIARLFYPWMLLTPQFTQLVLHAVFYGLPLGLMFASEERRRVPHQVPRAV